MTEICLNVGPTKVHPEVKQWLADAYDCGAVWRSHRSSWFGDLYSRVKSGLRELLDIPATHDIAFLASSNEIWERSMASLVEKESFHLVGGEFAERWKSTADKLGVQAGSFEFDHGFAGDLSITLVPANAEVICVTQNETSTGFWMPEDQITALAQQYPEKLMLVDVVSGVPYTRVPWQSVDLAYWSVQKGFCLPAGLAVAVFSPRIGDKAKKGLAFHGFDQLVKDAAKLQTTETPNVVGIYLLSRIIEKYHAEGIRKVRDDLAGRASRVYTGLAGTGLSPLVESEKYQSKTVIALRTTGSANDLRKKLEKEHGIIVGAGRGELVDAYIRIANFPSHTVADHEAFLKAVGS